MKPIKICRENLEKIQAELDRANGKAMEHTLLLASSVQALAKQYETQLETLGIPKGKRFNASGHFRSGHALPSAYKYPRKVTFLVMSRGTKDWFLEGVASGEAYGDAGVNTVILTKEQDAIAVANFREQYRVGGAV